EIARVHLRVVVEPISHFLDVGRHIEVVIHRAFAALVPAALRHCAPAAIGEDFGKTFGALCADAIFPPPFGDFGLVGRARAALIDTAHAVGELHKTADVVGGRMTAGELGPASGLGHGPRGLSVVVEPAGVINRVRQHVRHPAGGSAINRVHTAERAAGRDLLHLAIVDTVTMLMTYDGLDAGFVNEVAHE